MEDFWKCSPFNLSLIIKETYMKEKKAHFFKKITFNWRIIVLQYCGGFCHTLAWISHGVYVFHPEPPSHLSPTPSL